MWVDYKTHNEIQLNTQTDHICYFYFPDTCSDMPNTTGEYKNGFGRLAETCDWRITNFDSEWGIIQLWWGLVVKNYGKQSCIIIGLLILVCHKVGFSILGTKEKIIIGFNGKKGRISWSCYGFSQYKQLTVAVPNCSGK